jgi:hypothetical protein
MKKLIVIFLFILLFVGCAERTPIIPLKNNGSQFVVISIEMYYTMDRYYSRTSGGAADFSSILANTTSIILPRNSFKIGDTISVETIATIKQK